MIKFVLFEETEKVVKRVPQVVKGKIAFVTLQPTHSDIVMEELFSGASGKLFYAVMKQMRLDTELCCFLSLCDNMENEVTLDFSKLTEQGIALVVFCDKIALSRVHGKKQSDWRGSFWTDINQPGLTFTSIDSPSDVFSGDGSISLTFANDISRCFRFLSEPNYFFPRYEKKIIRDFMESILFVDQLPENVPTAFDIEGGVLTDVSCLSFCNSDAVSTSIVLEGLAPEYRYKVIQALCKKLPRLQLIVHNSLYDLFVLQKLWQVRFRASFFDTLLSSHVLHCELPKALAFQTSFHTGHPYYKGDRKSGDKDVFYQYNASDSWCTRQVWLAHKAMLTSEQTKHLEFLHNLVPPVLFLQHKGILFDVEKAAIERKELEVELLEIVKGFNSKYEEYPKPTTKKGKKVVETEWNPASSKQMCTLLYEHMKYPVQWEEKEVDGLKTRSKSTNVEALLTLSQRYNDPQADQVLQDLLMFRKLEKKRQFLATAIDSDNYFRCSYSIVGTETGRFSSSKSLSGTGTNMQTVSEKQKHLFLADPGTVIANCDLSGADGWTVAAQADSLGDPTMLLDYQFGLKPAKIIALMFLQGPHINDLSREELKILSKSVPEEGPDAYVYAGSKAAQHGSSYGMGAPTMSENLVKQSYKKTGKPVYVSVANMKELQGLFFRRYPGVRLWQNWVNLELQANRPIKTASNMSRKFYGRVDHKSKNTACSHEPQHNTAFATNNALLKLWLDPENRDSNNKLIIKPIHQVHDSLNALCPVGETTFLKRKMSEWFKTPLQIAGMEVTIPFSGKYGKDWKECVEEFR